MTINAMTITELSFIVPFNIKILHHNISISSADEAMKLEAPLIRMRATVFFSSSCVRRR